MALKPYFRLIRFRSWWPFLAEVALPAIIFTGGLSIPVFKLMILAYLSFNTLLYGGIYTINDVADVESDKKHPLKKKRAIASGEVSIASALIFGALLIVSGFITGFLFFNAQALYLYILFFALNLFYTFFAKHIPYLDMIGNSFSHPLRIILALVIIGYNEIPYFFISAYFFVVIGAVGIKRMVEKEVNGWEARSVLKHYPNDKLLLMQLGLLLPVLIIFYFDPSKHTLPYVTMISLYLVSVLATYFSKRIRILLKPIIAV